MLDIPVCHDRRWRFAICRISHGNLQSTSPARLPVVPSLPKSRTLGIQFAGMLAAQEYELAVAPFLPSEPDVKSLRKYVSTES